MIKPTGVGLVLLLVGLIMACQRDVSGSVPALEAQVTQLDCEANAGFAFVAGGDFVAGSDRTERDYAYRISAEGFADAPADIAKAEAGYRKRGWFDQERERQTVNLPAFCMSENLITNADYQVFVRATGHAVPGISAEAYQTQGFLVHDYREVEPYLWRGDQYPAGQGQHPVVLVSYEDALAYIEWRSQQDGVTYRLPTDLEWEKAARGTDGRYFPWGSEWRNDGTNWAKNGPAGTSAIATYPASRSPDGIEDMAGNVFEYTRTLVNSATADGPIAEVILKGCGWDDYPGFCRAAYEHDRPINSKHILFGFRLIIE
ncbi:MAG: SUMF1/EgtB/PvdO family nonheme iron enzyme [Phormidesmis sp.]